MGTLAFLTALAALALHFVPEHWSLRLRVKVKPIYQWVSYRELFTQPPAAKAKRP